MNDFSHPIDTAVAQSLRTAFPGVRVLGEYQSTPAQFPCVTVEEVSNLPAGQDNGPREPRSRITYRVQVFCLREEGGKEQARAMLAMVSDTLSALNFTRKSYTTQNQRYRASFYTMTATFEAEVDENGVLYRTR